MTAALAGEIFLKGFLGAARGMKVFFGGGGGDFGSARENVVVDFVIVTIVNLAITKKRLCFVVSADKRVLPAFCPGLYLTKRNYCKERSFYHSFWRLNFPIVHDPTMTKLRLLLLLWWVCCKWRGYDDTIIGRAATHLDLLQCRLLLLLH